MAKDKDVKNNSQPETPKTPKTKAPETTTTPAVVVTPAPKKGVVKRSMKPHASTITKLKNSATTAMKKAGEGDAKAVLTPLEKEAEAGLKLVREICKASTPPDGWSRLGHKIGAQNGRLDEELLNELGFAEVVTNVAAWGCATRRSDLKDNKTFIERLKSHMRYISGRKGDIKRTKCAKDFDRCGLKAKADEIYKALDPVCQIFEVYIKAGKF